MSSLREEIKATNAFNLITDVPLLITLDHDRNIASLGVNVAADIHNTTRTIVQKLLEEVLRATLARGVNDKQCLISRVRNVLEKDGSISGSESGIRQVIGAGVIASTDDRITGDVNT
jgi:hypothetical protein